MKRIFFALILILICLSSVAQQPGGGGGNHQAREEARTRLYNLQAEHISNALELSADVKSKFMVLYLTYARESEHHPPRNNRQAQQQRGEGFRPTDEQAEQMVLESFDMSIKAIELKKKYYYIFKEMLTPVQIHRMYEMERSIRSQLLKEQARRNRGEQ